MKYQSIIIISGRSQLAKCRIGAAYSRYFTIGRHTLGLKVSLVFKILISVAIYNIVRAGHKNLIQERIVTHCQYRRRDILEVPGP